MDQWEGCCAGGGVVGCLDCVWLIAGWSENEQGARGWRRRLGAAAAGGGEKDEAGLGGESRERRGGTALSSRVPLAGAGGWRRWLWAGRMGAGLSGTGDLARIFLSRLGAGRVRVGSAPAREAGVGCGNKAAYLRLDATARRAGAGRSGRRQRGGSTMGIDGRDSRLREKVGVGEGTFPPSIPPP